MIILLLKGVVKFEVKNQKISSRFNFIKNKSYEEIVLLDLFNNSIISFEIKKRDPYKRITKRN
jgi:hypothetical protein